MDVKEFSSIRDILSSSSPYLSLSMIFYVVKQFLSNPEKRDFKTIVCTAIIGVPLSALIGQVVFEYTGKTYLSFLVTSVSALLVEAIIGYFIQNDVVIVGKIIKKILKDDKK